MSIATIKNCPLWCLSLLLIGGLCRPGYEVLAQPGPSPFERLDRNGDGKITREELPEPIRNRFEQLDFNGDGSISPQEESQIRQRFQQQQAGQQAPSVPKGTKVFQNIPYVAGGGIRQQLDVYVPENAQGKLPLVIWVHGGGWRQGSKDRTRATFLLEHGYVVASINYRLTDTAIFPAQIHDCKAAIRFLKENAETYHINPEKVGVWGASAGGHLVALLGTAGDVSALEGDLGSSLQNSQVQAVCDYFGPTNFALMDEQTTIPGPIRHTAPDSPEAKLLGGPVLEVPELAQAASPITYVSPNDPPFLILHGDRDPLVPVAQSTDLTEGLKKVGVPVKLHVIEGGGHGPFHAPEQHQMVLEFFDSVLKE